MSAPGEAGEPDRSPRDPERLPDYRCPVCWHRSGMVLGPTQAFCTGGDECRVLLFDPSALDGGLAGEVEVDLLRRDVD